MLVKDSLRSNEEDGSARRVGAHAQQVRNSIPVLVHVCSGDAFYPIVYYPFLLLNVV